MRRVSRPVLLSFGLITLVAQPALEDRPIRGFSPRASRIQVEWETKFRALPNRDSLRSYMRHLSARPHHLGSPYDRANAEWLRDRMASFGWDATIDSFHVLFPTPLERVVELVAPTPVSGAARGARGCRRSLDPAAGGAAPDLQRVLRSTATSPRRWST